jgi:hypothetical protein
MDEMARYRETCSAAAGSIGESATDLQERRSSAARQRRIASRARGLAELMGERDDLAGVYEPADLAAEMLRWTA